MKIIYFNIAACAVLIMLIVSAFFKRIGTSNGNRAFIVLLVEVLLTTLFDMGAVYLDNLGAGNVGLKYFCHSGYLICHTFTAVFYLIYLISLTETWHKLLNRKGILTVMLLPAAIYLGAFIAGALGFPPIFYINGADVYTRGPTFMLGYLVGAFYLLVGIAYIVRFRNLYSKKWMLLLFLPYPFIAVAMVVEFFNPWLIIELFFNTLAFLFLYVNIQRPDEMKDPITGLAQAQVYEDYAKKAYSNKTPIAVIMADVVNGNFISDLYGIEGRYEFRKRLADELISINKEYKLGARIFAGRNNGYFMSLSSHKIGKTDIAAEAIKDRLSAPQTVGGLEVRPEIAVCVVNIPDDIPDFADFIRFGNLNFEELPIDEVNKASTYFSNKFNQMKLKINRIIEDALDYNRLEVYYQPIYSLQEKRFVSAEALIRLKDPEYGFVPPDIFIQAAERSGSINRIWDFIINSVCSFIASEGFKQTGIDYIEVNLSAVQCMDDRIASDIKKLVDSYKIDRSTIGIEITETAVINNYVQLKDTLDELSYSGMKICLDDFGTGYSDTRRLLDLPIDIVKLDKTFLEGIEGQGIRNVVGGFIRILKEEGYHIVAEGVETEHVLDILDGFHCDYIQGYYFSKPVPEKDFVEFCVNNGGRKNGN